eukprot:GILK01006782.1.p1 GENE.GILK01006782.1~~GILK01006782.1.p1  ORF type:complete len:704 (-),score=158.23 GILK01006782.1:220-2331(-)
MAYFPGRPDAIKQFFAGKKAEGDAILDKVNKLASYAKQTKQKTTVTKHKFEWIQQHNRLKKDCSQVDDELRCFLAAHAPSAAKASTLNMGSGFETVLGAPVSEPLSNAEDGQREREEERRLVLATTPMPVTSNLWDEVLAMDNEMTQNRLEMAESVSYQVDGLRSLLSDIRSQRSKLQEALEASKKPSRSASPTPLRRQLSGGSKKTGKFLEQSAPSFSTPSGKGESCYEPLDTEPPEEKLRVWRARVVYFGVLMEEVNAAMHEMALSLREEENQMQHELAGVVSSILAMDNERDDNGSRILALGPGDPVLYALPNPSVDNSMAIVPVGTTVPIVSPEEEAIRLNYARGLRALEERLNLELNRLKGQITEDSSGLWDEDSHFRFKKIHREYIGHGKSRESYMERLWLEFPHLERKDLELHDHLVESHRWTKTKRKALLSDYEREKSELRSKAEGAWAELQREKGEKENAEAAMLKQELHCQRVHEEHAVLKEEFDRKQSEKQMLERIQQERIAAKEKERQQREALERARKKLVANDFKQIKREQEEICKKQMEVEALAQHTMLKETISKNKVRVEQRQDEMLGIMAYRKQKQHEAVQLQQEKQERLARAAEKFKVEVEADPTRLTRFTATLTAKHSEGYDVGGGIPLYNVHGFTQDQLMKDMRFKVMSALQTAGLANTEYGRELIAKTQSIRPPRPDQRHSAF